jgi:hypothetical protein
MCTDVCIVYRSRLTSKYYLYRSFFMCLQQYATMHSSSLIPYYDNTQSELKVLTFGDTMYHSSNN